MAVLPGDVCLFCRLDNFEHLWDCPARGGQTVRIPSEQEHTGEAYKLVVTAIAKVREAEAILTRVAKRLAKKALVIL